MWTGEALLHQRVSPKLSRQDVDQVPVWSTDRQSQGVSADTFLLSYLGLPGGRRYVLGGGDGGTGGSGEERGEHPFMPEHFERGGAGEGMRECQGIADDLNFEQADERRTDEGGIWNHLSRENKNIFIGFTDT